MAEAAVALQNVCVDYPGIRAVDDISWSLMPGCRAAVLGPNGCGKTSLLRAITGYGHITSGTAKVLGATIGKTEIHALRKRMGIVDPRLPVLLGPEVTARQLVATGFFGHLTTFFDRPTPGQLRAAEGMLEEVGLAPFVRQPMHNLSSGQKSRVWLARALANQPDLLILDEPTADLDLKARETLLATLHQLALARPTMTILIVTHHLEDLLPGLSETLLLSSGTAVAQGDPESVLTDENLSAAFGCPVRVRRCEGRWQWSVSASSWAGLLRQPEN